MRSAPRVSEMYFKMATSFSPGGHSPTSLSRTLEKVFDEAQHTGELNLSGRKLKEYPKVASKYDLTDTSCAGEFCLGPSLASVSASFLQLSFNH